MCFNTRHTTDFCRCYFPTPASSASSAPYALVAIDSGEANEAIWYPNSRAFTHMNPTEGILFSKHPWSNQINVIVGDDTKLPALHIDHGLLPPEWQSSSS